MNSDKLPTGMNVIVAIASYGGYNQEDSVLFNKSAIQRGLFASTFYRTYKEEERKINCRVKKIYCKPDIERLLFYKPCNYDKITESGFVKENEELQTMISLLVKVMPIKDNKDYNYRDSSVSIKNNEEGYIDKNYVNTNGEGYKFCKDRGSW